MLFFFLNHAANILLRLVYKLSFYHRITEKKYRVHGVGLTGILGHFS